VCGTLTKTVRHASVGEFALGSDILAALGTDLRIMASQRGGRQDVAGLRLLDVGPNVPSTSRTLNGSWPGRARAEGSDDGVLTFTRTRVGSADWSDEISDHFSGGR
jgi:hypothetical protein